MNEFFTSGKLTATAALIGFNAALAATDTNWPVEERSYVTSQSSPTYSFVERTLTIAQVNRIPDFAQSIASIFASLSEYQEPLGSDLEAIWNANLDELYQS